MRTVMLAVFLSVVVCVSSKLMAYSDGDGLAGDPYQISSVMDWQELMTTPADWDKQFVLTADIDLAGVTLTPVGNSSTNFAGVLDGGGHIVNHATINQPSNDYTGLFGYLGNGGQIKYLGAVAVDIDGHNYAGGLIGWNQGSITSCYATGAVNGNNEVGGLAGWSAGAIVSCHAEAVVYGNAYIGGLAGSTMDTTVENCYATGTVTGNFAVGGLAGNNNYAGTIISCYATGDVNATGYNSSYFGGLVGLNNNSNMGVIVLCHATGDVIAADSYAVGGLVGENGGTIDICYATGSVYGNHNVGGLAGLNYSPITSSYHTAGLVTGDQWVGGLVGRNCNTINACYARDTVSGTAYIGGLVGKNTGIIITSSYAASIVSGDSCTGGLVGWSGMEQQFCQTFCDEFGFCWQTCFPLEIEDQGLVEKSFWDTQISGQSTSSGGTGKMTAEMMTLSTFLAAPANWDFTNETTNGIYDFWRLCANDDYPRLNWESIEGDFACPNGVSLGDLAYFAGQWLMNDCTSANNYCSRADMDISSGVNLADFAILTAHWLEGI